MKKLFLFFIVSLLLISCTKENHTTEYLIPKPFSLKPSSGVFLLSDKTSVSIADFIDVVAYFQESLMKYSGKKIATETNGSENVIGFYKIEDQYLGKEGYRLFVEKTKISIFANDKIGAINAVHTLIQLLLLNDMHAVPCVEIVDKPQLQWRGFMLDVARQFYPKKIIFKLIDVLSFYKMNILHLHLSDDQGWRIEIENLPELTKIGSLANPLFKDVSSGYYSKNDIREIVRYAAQRNITIVPEIDMPGHSRAAICSYPSLSCFGGPGKFDNYNPRDSLPFYDPVCAGNENTYLFYEKVIKEIAELFPSEYIHIGGDETSKTCWKTCKHCQSIIKKENLKDEQGLQNYFAMRIQKIIESNGRKAMGWDELYETGAPVSFATMAWREEQWGVDAARENHKVVFAPCQYYYFNYNQVYDNERRWSVSSPLHMVFKNEIPQAENILGIHSCHWGDSDTTGNKMFETIFPRIIALADKAWATDNDNYNHFLERLSYHYLLLDKINIPYYVAHPDGLYNDLCIKEKYTVNLSVPIHHAAIHYTIDGTEPDIHSPVYTKAFDVEIGTVIKAKTILPNGKSSITVTGDSKKAELIPAINETITLNKGLKMSVYKGAISTLRNRETMTQVSEEVTSKIEYPDASLKHNFGLSFEGYINIPADGVYSFILNSSDGSNLFIDGDTIVSNDGKHPRLTIMQRTALAKGFHNIRLDYFYSSIFEKHLLLEITGPGMERQEIPANLLFHKK